MKRSDTMNKANMKVFLRYEKEILRAQRNNPLGKVLDEKLMELKEKYMKIIGQMIIK